MLRIISILFLSQLIAAAPASRHFRRTPDSEFDYPFTPDVDPNARMHNPKIVGNVGHDVVGGQSRYNYQSTDSPGGVGTVYQIQ